MNKHKAIATELDNTDRRLLNILQAAFPLSPEPFAEVGTVLGISEGEVLQRTRRLKGERIIRYIGPVFDSRSLGYTSTLVAMRIPDDRIEKAAATVNHHPGVSHNYMRDDDYNLWFTISVPPEGDIDSELNKLVENVKPERVLNMPALRQFKIGTFFDMSGNGSQTAEKPQAYVSFGSADIIALSPIERAVAGALQQDLSLTDRPFDEMADNIGVQLDGLLGTCRRLMERGILRRFGASINHYNAGFDTNAMVCWKVEADMVEGVAAIMSGFPEVSHCYERRTAPDWPYNLFTMVHGRTQQEVNKKVLDMAGRAGIKEYKSLFTLREFKKKRIKLKV